VDLVNSKQRVADHGEVFTPAWMVEAMLNLVSEETERIDSRFLEPACGSGDFLVQVLPRKLAAVEPRFGRSEFERSHDALLGLMCIYGIELLDDNIVECRDNLLEIVYMRYLCGRAWACSISALSSSRHPGSSSPASVDPRSSCWPASAAWPASCSCRRGLDGRYDAWTGRPVRRRHTAVRVVDGIHG
jgi:hypothetical protein